MSAFVVLSVAIAVAIVAVTGLVGFRLFRTARDMARAVGATAERIGPLAEELQDELAVTQTELEQLQQRASRARKGGRGS